jgi:LacI family transcriptional regulator
MHEIAERAGVGKATVSLALRDDPRLRPETRRRIQKLAAKMGYRTNATVANLMAQLRASRSPKYHATLGLLNASSDPKTLTGAGASREWVTGCHERAGQLGYGLEPFWLHEPGITPARLAGILESRNIRGLIISALLDRSGLPDRFDLIWQQFACVVVGLRPVWPPLHFSTNDQFSTAFRAVQRLWENGYRRMGLVLSPELDAMVDRRFSAGFWAGHEALGGRERLPVFPFHETRETSFRAWYAEYRPDVILCIHEEVKTWLEEMQIDVPAQVGLAHLDRHDELPGWSGMHQNNALVGAAAVDMLVGQLHRNEIGLPDSPQASFTQSTWVDGPTTASNPPRAANESFEPVRETAPV